MHSPMEESCRSTPSEDSSILNREDNESAVSKGNKNSLTALHILPVSTKALKTPVAKMPVKVAAQSARTPSSNVVTLPPPTPKRQNEAKKSLRTTNLVEDGKEDKDEYSYEMGSGDLNLRQHESESSSMSSESIDVSDMDINEPQARMGNKAEEEKTLVGDSLDDNKDVREEQVDASTAQPLEELETVVSDYLVEEHVKVSRDTSLGSGVNRNFNNSDISEAKCSSKGAATGDNGMVKYFDFRPVKKNTTISPLSLPNKERKHVERTPVANNRDVIVASSTLSARKGQQQKRVSDLPGSPSFINNNADELELVVGARQMGSKSSLALSRKGESHVTTNAKKITRSKSSIGMHEISNIYIIHIYILYIM